MCITGCVHLDRFAIPPVDKNLTVLTEHRVWVAAPAIDLPAGRRPQNPVNPRRKKYFRFPESQSDVHSLPFRFGRRGVSPTSRNVRRNAGAAAASQGEAMFEAVLLGSGGCGLNRGMSWRNRAADGEVVWSWRGHAGA